MRQQKLSCTTKITNFLLKAWYQPKLAWYLCLLLPIEAVYRAVIYLKYKLTKPFKSLVPVIVVGNITLGGTGKTPLILWLIDYLTKKGLKVAVISRGYKANTPFLPYQVNASDDPVKTGDEPLLIAQTGVNVVIDPKRVRAIKKVLANNPDIVLSDDGLQHYALGRSLELVMIDNNRRLGNQHCLPTGPLREPIKRLKYVDAVIYNGIAKNQADFYITLEPYAFINLKTGKSEDLDFFANMQNVYAVAGIGNPIRFFATLTKLKLKVNACSLPDHAQFNANIFKFEYDFPIIMTAKDAVKCTKFATKNMWYLAVKTVPSDNFINWFECKISELMTKGVTLKNET